MVIRIMKENLLHVTDTFKYTDSFCSCGLLLSIGEMLQREITFKGKGNVFEEHCECGCMASRQTPEGLHECTC